MHLAQDKAKRGNGQASVLSEGRVQFGGPLMSTRAPPGQLTMKVRAVADESAALSRGELKKQLQDREALTAARLAGSTLLAHRLPSLPQIGGTAGASGQERSLPSAAPVDKDFGAIPWTRALVRGKVPSKEVASGPAVVLTSEELAILRKFDDDDIEIQMPAQSTQAQRSSGAGSAAAQGTRGSAPMGISDSEDDSDSDSEDDEEALRRELAKLRAEREHQQRVRDEVAAAKQIKEAEDAAAASNPLLAGSFTAAGGDASQQQGGSGSGAGRALRWDEDVVFRNQMRGTAVHPGRRFINDTVRNDFHRRFMAKFIQ